MAPRRRASMVVDLREVTPPQLFKLYLTWKQRHHEPKNEHPEAFCFHLTRSSVRLRTLKQEHFQRKWILFFPGFPLSRSARFSFFPPNSDFWGWNSKHLQCSVKKLLYIYIFYSWLVFYFSPLYIKTNKLFLKTSRFSLSHCSAGTGKKEQKVNKKHLIQAFCIITSTHGRKTDQSQTATFINH